MFNRALSRAKAATARSFRPKTEALIYAIGDVHGRLDLFDRLLADIRRDAQDLNGERPIVVLLGDLIDRGPESAGCLERACALANEDWCTTEVLLGNHEQVMLAFLTDAGQGEGWLRYGGGATLLSYGIEPNQAARASWAGLSATLAEALPETHLRLLRQAKSYIEIDDYLFVHAGVRPGVPLAQQTARDMLWIRSPFLEAENPYPGKVVVHGHTPMREPRMTRFAIGVDTGAYATGVLTAIRLHQSERKLLQTL